MEVEEGMEDVPSSSPSLFLDHKLFFIRSLIGLIDCKKVGSFDSNLRTSRVTLSM
jgi:hypothetical protein